MADTERLTQEFLVCGISGFTGNVYEGSPTFSPALPPAAQAVADLVYAAHIEDLPTYMTTDQRVNAACLAVYNAVSPEQWDAYRNIQAKYILFERRKRQREGVCLERHTCSDLKDKWLQSNLQEDRNAWLLSILAIRNALPFPSGQGE